MAERAARAAPRLWRIAPRVILVILASLLQFHHVTRDLRFHPDEAHFMTFAREAAVKGDWMLPGALDKPPLSIYLSALSLVAVGLRADEAGVLHLDPLLGEFAGRLPNALLALLLTALMMRLAQRLYRSEFAALIAGFLTATSPFILAYGASAFTDMSLVFWALLSLYAALERRFMLVAVALGLALWSKQQALFALPLILALMRYGCAQRYEWRRFLLTLGGVCAALLLWDAARPEASLFLQAVLNNAPPQTFSPPAAWLERLTIWLESGAWLLGPPVVALTLLAITALAQFSEWRSKTVRSGKPLGRLFLLSILVYLLLHTAFNFNLYGRYLLLLCPLLILLVAGTLGPATASSHAGRFLRIILVPLLLIGALWTFSAPSALIIERDRYAGIDDLAAHLNRKPVATVIYDPWLGWELGYYLGPWHDKRRVHYPNAEALVSGALALDEVGDRFLVAPVTQPLEEWLAALADARFDLELDYQRDGFVVYRILP